MSFRDTMDKIWSSKIKHYLYLFLFFILCIGQVILPFSGDFILIVVGTFMTALVTFQIYFIKTIGRGYQDLVRIYKPVAVKENQKKAWLMLLLFLLIFVLIHICTNYDEYRGIAFAMLIVVIFVFGILYYLSTSNESSLDSENNFLRLVVTKSKLIVYSSGYEISKFDRSTLKYFFVGADELKLLGEGQSQQKDLIVNLYYLPENDKQELRSLLGDETEDLNKD